MFFFLVVISTQTCSKGKLFFFIDHFPNLCIIINSEWPFCNKFSRPLNLRIIRNLYIYFINKFGVILRIFFDSKYRINSRKKIWWLEKASFFGWSSYHLCAIYRRIHSRPPSESHRALGSPAVIFARCVPFVSRNTHTRLSFS